MRSLHCICGRKKSLFCGIKRKSKRKKQNKSKINGKRPSYQKELISGDPKNGSRKRMFELTDVRVNEWFLQESIRKWSRDRRKQFGTMKVRVIWYSSYREFTVSCNSRTC